MIKTTDDAILDALDVLSYARDMAILISECDHKPAGSTAYMVAAKIEQATTILQGAVQAKAVAA